MNLEHALLINHFHISFWTVGTCLALARKNRFHRQKAVFDEVAREGHQCAFVSLTHLRSGVVSGGGQWLQRSKS